jgi:hypothetical protein
MGLSCHHSQNEVGMKIKEQTIQALDRLTALELMLVNELVMQLYESHYPAKRQEKWSISTEQLYAATSRCKRQFSDEIIQQREDRV